jgi:ParB-like chromosome segregation protein Spo0J
VAKKGRFEDFFDAVKLGDEEAADAGVVILPEIDQLVPDGSQPRRGVVPDDLREMLLSGELTPKKVILQTWERCLDREVHKALKSGSVSPSSALSLQRTAGPRDLALQLSLEGLVTLADSIAAHGLVQPVNVYRTTDGRYRITVGERRWWAHVHLWYVMGVDKARRIRAIELPPPEDDVERVARQYAENVHRKDLSDIAKARAIAGVRAVVEQEAAVSRGTSGSMPTSVQLDEMAGRRVAEVTGRGVSGRTVRHYLVLLSLPPEARRLAEAAKLSERSLREIATIKDDEAQVRLVTQLAREAVTATEAAEEARAIKAAERHSRGGRPRSDDALKKALRRFRSSVGFAAGDPPKARDLAQQIVALPDKKRSEVVELAAAYAEYLVGVLEALEKELPKTES